MKQKKLGHLQGVEHKGTDFQYHLLELKSTAMNLLPKQHLKYLSYMQTGKLQQRPELQSPKDSKLVEFAASKKLTPCLGYSEPPHQFKTYWLRKKWLRQNLSQPNFQEVVSTAHVVVKLVFLVLAELHETPQAFPSIPGLCGGCWCAATRLMKPYLVPFESRKTTLSWQKDPD